MSNEYIIREAKIEDAERLIEIYSYYVLNTAVSFEYEVPTVSTFRDMPMLGLTALVLRMIGQPPHRFMWIKITEEKVLGLPSIKNLKQD